MKWLKEVIGAEAMTSSSIFDRKGRFEMGRKLDMMSGVSPGLLRMGVTAASLREGGTDPDLREDDGGDELGDGREALFNKFGGHWVKCEGGVNSSHEVGQLHGGHRGEVEQGL